MSSNPQKSADPFSASIPMRAAKPILHTSAHLLSTLLLRCNHFHARNPLHNSKQSGSLQQCQKHAASSTKERRPRKKTAVHSLAGMQISAGSRSTNTCSSQEVIRSSHVYITARNPIQTPNPYKGISRKKAGAHMAARPLISSAAGVKGPRDCPLSALLKRGASEPAAKSTKVTVISVGSCAHWDSTPLPADVGSQNIRGYFHMCLSRGTGRSVPLWYCIGTAVSCFLSAMS